MKASELSKRQLAALPPSAFCGPGRTIPVLSSADVPVALHALAQVQNPTDAAAIKATLLQKAVANRWLSTLPPAWLTEGEVKA